MNASEHPRRRGDFFSRNKHKLIWSYPRAQLHQELKQIVASNACPGSLYRVILATLRDDAIKYGLTELFVVVQHTVFVMCNYEFN